MAYLSTYTKPLTAKTAAHLLRRATFGPTNKEIADFTGMTAWSAIVKLIDNAALRKNPPPPVEMDGRRSDVGQEFLTKPWTLTRKDQYFEFIRYWWMGLMTEQTGNPSILEKLAAFWQNHFVTAHNMVGDYRQTYNYLTLIRANSLGNFRNFVIAITKDPNMLMYLDGNSNTKKLPNENYAREMQELFTVGQKNFKGVENYTETDVKTAARVLTGWQVKNYYLPGTPVASFNATLHDTTDKTFSSAYGNKVIKGRSGDTAGDDELKDLINMLLAHPECPKFIVRKIYRYFVNNNVTDDIETNVIIPLADRFVKENFNIMPVIRSLLSSDIFYDENNIGAIIKSPAEFVIGTMRHFDQKVPDMKTDSNAFMRMMLFQYQYMERLQMNFLDQPSVFGSVPYYQTGFSTNWINGSTLGIRGACSDAFAVPYWPIRDTTKIGVDWIAWLKVLQPNFYSPATTPTITAETAFNEMVKGLFVFELDAAKKNFLIDTIMMRGTPRATWEFELKGLRSSTTNIGVYRDGLTARCQTVMKYMLRMAEYQVF